MSSVPPTGNASAQRVPAWKRLGLKLKPASEESHNATLNTDTVAPPVPNHHRENIAGPINVNAKRKSSGVPALDHSAKKPKRDASQSQIASTQTPSKKAKSVSFAAESTQQAGSAATASNIQIRNKQKQPSPRKAVTAPVKKQAAVNLEPALSYLRQWHTSKDTWKFNKNHQTRLLEQVFADETTIPAADINVFYEYIQGLKGAVRTRLRELASGTKAQDMELGSQGFPTSSKEVTERRQREYEEVIAAFLRQPRITGKRRFDEIDYVLRTSDMEMQRRVVKRMRCENVLDELSDSETETVSTTTTAEDSEGATSEGATAAAEDVQRLRLNDGPLQRVKRKRKSRTVVVDEDTSSESDSGSDSDSDSSSGSSDSSSSDDESDNEAAQPQLRTDDADTSSSSSSSESESASDDSDDDDSENDN